MPRRSVRHRSRLSLGAAALALGALCVAAAFALAAHPVAGGHYKGQIENSPVNTKISFKVSNDGSTVKGLKTSSTRCSSAAAVPRRLRGSSRSLTRPTSPAKGKFRGVIHYSFNGATAKAVVKGQFHRHGAETGKVTATFEANPSCDGTAHFETEVD